MKILTTPADRFVGLKDYPFDANYIEVQENLKMHYVDEGKGPLIVLLHGEPSWSYLYRKMIPILVDADFRVIAPDLIGFGKSDKPSEVTDYSFQNHMNWLSQLFIQLNLENAHLFAQDWGGLLGLRMAGEQGHLFSSITVSNTFLPRTGVFANDAFKKWRDFSQQTPHFSSAGVLQMATVSELSKETLAAYEAPFPDDSYKAGARIFPTLVPFDGEDPYSALPACDSAWKNLELWEKPFLTLFADSDPIMKGGDFFFQAKVPGTKGQPHQTIVNAGHFVQEDKGEELAQLLSNFIKANS